ncbi:cation:proton antiporter [Umezakia ovalisporum]|uniref:Cation:proton antiporter n=1 Tax=Umezakia ovalisporum FSS-43 TaxID=2740520 RepID=A0ABT6K2P2_9CYAN|nr:cation:proton antiporter [Umezakia ovalisporum]MDH6056265.1 cation:proton antiporter [Umezakia ovalisporum FSS-43]MDH6067779.1 cation:proton antiporter [Umezakia ovalisporum APH033B]MDH6070913.1 cation:proton antiporter [Umezakia ovalisporum CobakiLakeA]MDH6074490.1 cation:proton antiporter [Umezakia ovalisporum CS-1034]MDH6079123.1 cation:proton antiporter [Umezakia ovalisporum FSS-45]
MNESVQGLPLLVLLVGMAIAMAILIKSGLESISVPALVGYLLVGFLLSLMDHQWHILSSEGEEIFDFLAELGIIALLFRVGLESDLAGLMSQVSRASMVWVGDVLVSGTLAFVVCYWFLQLSLISSLFVSIAMTATSVGVAVGVWQEEKATNSPNGQLMLDVAEMDDISSVILMALLFAIAPLLKESANGSILPVIIKTAGGLLLKSILFATVCYVFSRYFEQAITVFLMRIEKPPDPMLTVASIGLIIAAISGLLGFSVAIGAFFAGLVFSRDPQAVKLDTSFSTLYEFFVPFFFIGIGLQIDPNALRTALGLGGALLIVAVLGKIIGAGIPAVFITGWVGATLVGVSLVPRAEIALIIMQRGLSLGNWAISPQVFAAMVVVSGVTSIATPLILQRMLEQWPQTQPGKSS